MLLLVCTINDDVTVNQTLSKRWCSILHKTKIEMKKQFLYPALCLQLLLTAVVVCAQPGWVNDPAPYQYSMTMVAQIQVDGVPNHQLNNHLGAFRQGQIRGYGTPVEFNGEAYYFLSFFSNTYKGDTLYFRAFLGA